ncbi:hypothetical protein GCM10022403_089680 [Streptomyces coacervatus]|uniref:Secreted protein n=1 Tax=Streptomyces coacervatus TaxID=647381 RepID=A0ABP7JG82_9ACTN|nr:hypothetical protein [Streptomyces coacervatus]MDF2271190.1 hypothetical protein [Streptomyces coacervatus]
MRAPAVLAAIALAGTVLFGGAAQALADGRDDDLPTNDVGNVGGDQDGVFGPASHSNADFDSGATGFRKLGGTFDWASGH